MKNRVTTLVWGLGYYFGEKGIKIVAENLLEKTRNARFAARQVQFAGRTVRSRSWCPSIDAFAARTHMFAARTDEDAPSRREGRVRGANCSEQDCSLRELMGRGAYCSLIYIFLKCKIRKLSIVDGF